MYYINNTNNTIEQSFNMELIFNGYLIINDITNYYETYKLGTPVCNVIAIGGSGGGLCGPAYLYDNIIKFGFINCLFTRVDIKYPSFEKYDSKHHFDHSVILLKNICKKIHMMNNLPIILIGWSKGGAIIIESVFQLQNEINFSAIISIAPQLVGTENLINIFETTHKIFIHGNNDNVLSHELTDELFKIPKINKQKIIIENGDHFLSNNDEYLFNIVGNFIQNLFL